MVKNNDFWEEQQKSPFDVHVFVGRDYERAEGELNFAQHEMTHEAPWFSWGESCFLFAFDATRGCFHMGVSKNRGVSPKMDGW